MSITKQLKNLPERKNLDVPEEVGLQGYLIQFHKQDKWYLPERKNLDVPEKVGLQG